MFAAAFVRAIFFDDAIIRYFRCHADTLSDMLPPCCYYAATRAAAAKR